MKGKSEILWFNFNKKKIIHVNELNISGSQISTLVYWQHTGSYLFIIQANRRLLAVVAKPHQPKPIVNITRVARTLRPFHRHILTTKFLIGNVRLTPKVLGAKAATEEAVRAKRITFIVAIMASLGGAPLQCVGAFLGWRANLWKTARLWRMHVWNNRDVSLK